MERLDQIVTSIALKSFGAAQLLAFAMQTHYLNSDEITPKMQFILSSTSYHTLLGVAAASLTSAGYDLYRIRKNK